MITVILHEIENKGNLGAIIRSMGNFNLNKLILINPQCDVNSEEVKKRAKNSKKVKITTLNSLEELKLDCLIGTTAKLGTEYNIPRLSLSPKETSKLIQDKNKVGIILGRESIGLTNKEIEHCDFITHIPTHKSYKTLNISHAATIIFYELFKNENKPKTEYINLTDKKVLLNLINTTLNHLNFEDKKKETQIKTWKNLIGKGFLTKREFFVLCGFFKKVTKVEPQ